MKSIMEEASTIAKAIEKGWQQAGQPKEFSVKVYEEPVTSFFGLLTKRPAKIALFFEDRAPARTPQPQHGKKQHTSSHTAPTRPQRQPAAQQSERPARPERTDRPARPERSERQQPVVEKQNHARTLPEGNSQPWTDSMVGKAKEWVDNLLQSLSKSSVQYTVQPKNYYLKVTFEEPLLASTEHDRQLFRNSSYLLMQALRTSCKKSLRGYKIIISGPGTERNTKN